MSDETAASNFITDLQAELKTVRRAVGDELAQFLVTTRNLARRLQGARLDYVILPIGGPLPERAGPPRSFFQRQLPLPTPPPSLEGLNHRLQAIADADNVKGVLLIFHGFAAGLATLQNVRRALQRLQAAGKEVIVYTPFLDLAHYYVAAAADRIIVTPGARFEVLGLRTEAIFLREALARAGVSAEVIQISPYKTGANMFGEADMTPEQREQLDWLLDDQFDLLTAGMAAGRGQTQAAIQALIDQAPYSAEKALELGLVDAIAYKDELAELLAETEIEQEQEEKEEAGIGALAEQKGKKARLLTWDKARPLLLEKMRRRPAKFIGVISLEGLIVMGPSRQPPLIPLPFLGAAAGERTLTQLLRRAERLPGLAALILHVDSGGGSSLASELITREIKRLGQKMPVLAYMGNVAASGGYHVSAPAGHIMSQAGTITGSIGVFMVRPNTQGLYQRLNVQRVSLQRGRRAGLYSDEAPLTADEEAILWRSVEETYRSFKRVVADGRSLPYEELDPICEGRVWTGRQALTHKLVDNHGDFVDAIHQAAELAGLPTGEDDAIPTVNLYPQEGRYLPPRPFTADEALAEIGRWLFGEQVADWGGRPLLLMPYELKFK